MKNSRGKKILVVDDECSHLKMLEWQLDNYQFNVVTADNGNSALNHLSADPPDLILTDLFMPEMDGFELLARVNEKNPELPVIVLSGQGGRGDVIQALRLGAWDYLYKPIEQSSFLLLTIDRALEKARLLTENRIYREQLEKLVACKTDELVQQKHALAEKADSLEKVNSALKNLLDQREIEKKAIEEAMVDNLKRFVFPYLDELDTSSLDLRVSSYLGIIRTNIENLISPIAKRLGGVYHELTPAEIKVADLIRQGQPTKTIASILNTSPSTVEKHRNSIRKKLKILNTKTNLNTHLNAIS